jgi:hypothetical protein
LKIRYPDLASNLVAITNQGQNVFIEAYSDMLQIGSKTNNMGGKNGKVGASIHISHYLLVRMNLTHISPYQLDDLAKFFGDPEAESATNRTLRSLQTAIDTCNDSGKRTEKDFRTWFGSVNRLHLAVVGAQSKKPTINENIRFFRILSL